MEVVEGGGENVIALYILLIWKLKSVIVINLWLFYPIFSKKFKLRVFITFCMNNI